MPLSSSERKETGLLHGISSNNSANSVHASSSTTVSQDGRWKNKPTPIDTPKNGRNHWADVSASTMFMPRQPGKNPWNGVSATTMSKPTPNYNRTANATMTKTKTSNSYARKKIKTDHTSGQTQPNASSANVLAPQEDGEPIDVDDAYGPSTDDLNIVGDRPYSPLTLQQSQSNGHASNAREDFTVAPDGPATSRLKRSMQPINVDSDPIEQFESSDFVPSSKPMNVRDRVAHLNQIATIPNLANLVDLRTVNKRRPIKARMKTKDPQPFPSQHASFAASSLSFPFKQQRRVDKTKIIHPRDASAKREVAESGALNYGLTVKTPSRTNTPRMITHHDEQKVPADHTVPSSIPAKRHGSEEVETLDESTTALSVSESKNQTTSEPVAETSTVPPRFHKQSRDDLNRRRSCRNLDTNKPPVDPEEIILVYPQGKPGAVNINNADLSRLEPGEFLNDNLIEFGLKLWLQSLEDTDPALAKDIHVFSSFFYKKLNKKNIAEGYDSVRKWTSKFDLFAKKYVIVPINENLHWYLAIIYQPEHMLLPPTPSTRPQTRLSVSNKVINQTSETSTRESSPAEVERDLKNFNTSCTVDDIDPSQKPSPNPIEEELDKTKHFSRPRSRAAIDMDVDHELTENSKSRSVSGIDLPDVSKEDYEDEDSRSSRSIDHNLRNAVQNFYASIPLSKKARGKQKAVELPAMDVNDKNTEGEASQPQGIQRTYIFTLDSLGSRHPQAVQQLQKYLVLEAKDKKKLDKTSPTEGKAASVPVQPNYCDCGIYLLHLAQTFMTDPEGYCARILAPRGKKAIPNAVRQTDWNDAKVAGMREELAKQIKRLSMEWKKDRDAREEVKKREAGPQIEVLESSDDEIDIVASTVPALKSKGKAKAATPKQIRANRIRG